MINKILLSTAALVALAGTAFAADLPSRRAPPVFAPPPPVPVFSWTGFYIGGQVGYDFGSDNALATTGGAFVQNGGASPKGIIGGGHIGYNFSSQSLPVLGSIFGGAFGSGVVIGVEGDVDGTSASSNYNLGALGAAGVYTNVRTDIQGSARGRLGYAFDRILVYGTGGAAFAGPRETYRNNVTGAVDSLNHTRVGYTVGGGIEYAITNNFSLRAEYRYSDFGSYTDILGATTGGAVAVRQREKDNRVQGGFSYKFDTFAPAAPVVARY